MHYDIIVVGAGLGGLTAGAKLAREGKKVLVIEQHSKPGGCATTFRRGDYTLEVGLHEMDGPSPKDMKTRIFNELGVFEKVKFIRLPEFYRFINGRTDLVIPHDPAEASALLKKNFPAEQEGIDAYFNQLLNRSKVKPSDNKQADISLGEFLDSIFREDEIKLVLLGNLGYFHDDPYSISLNYYTVAQGSYFSGGASYIRGGSQKLPDCLAEYIAEHGGKVLVNHIVTDIVAEGTKVKGVIFRNKRDPLSEKTMVSADEIIMNGAIPNLPELLPQDYKPAFSNEISRQKAGASLLTIYFGFRGSLDSAGNKYYSTFVFDPTIKSQADILANNRGDFHKRSFAFVDYGRIDSGLATKGKSVGSVCCIDYLKDWESLSGEEYVKRKNEVTEIFKARLEAVFPGIGEKIAYCDAGTPSTIKRYTLNPGGEVYGFAQNPSRPSVSTYGILENLHIASAWGKTGGGFSGAIYSGYLCAINVMRKMNVR